MFEDRKVETYKYLCLEKKRVVSELLFACKNVELCQNTVQN